VPVPDDHSLLQILRDDRRTYGPRGWAEPGFHALAIHRWAMVQARRPSRFPLGLAARAFRKLLFFLTRAVYGIEIHPGSDIGRGLMIVHQGGIVLGAERIGDDCVVRQNVTIGQAVVEGPRPIVGDRVDIGAGAVIVGGITIGDGTKIGPNAVVTRSVSPDSLVVTPPARILRRPGARQGLADNGDART
jgi:serine O-acetyltransferase